MKRDGAIEMASCRPPRSAIREAVHVQRFTTAARTDHCYKPKMLSLAHKVYRVSINCVRQFLNHRGFKLLLLAAEQAADPLANDTYSGGHGIQQTLHATSLMANDGISRGGRTSPRPTWRARALQGIPSSPLNTAPPVNVLPCRANSAFPSSR